MFFIYIAPHASEALFVNHLSSAPSQRECKLGFEHDPFGQPAQKINQLIVIIKQRIIIPSLILIINFP